MAPAIAAQVRHHHPITCRNRRLKERQIEVRCVLTKAAQQFVTPLSASALSHERVYTDLFDPESEFDAGHIRLARDCDLMTSLG